METMYPAKINSPVTELSGAIDDTQTTIPLLDASALPAAPNLATIGVGETAETILYTGISSNDLTGVTRGFQGTASAWGVGQKVARYFTAYDHDTFKGNIEEIQAKLDAADPVAISLSQGTNIVEATQESPVSNVSFSGRSLVNLLGRDGNFESLTPWTVAGSPTLATSPIKYGSNSLETLGSASVSYAYKDFTTPIPTSNNHVLLVWVYIESFSSGVPQVSLRDVGTSTSRYSANVLTTTTGQWQMVRVKIPASHALVGNGFRLYVGSTASGTFTVYWDGARIVQLADTEYTDIDNLTDAEVEQKYPYVDSLQSVNAPWIITPGKNLYAENGGGTARGTGVTVTYDGVYSVTMGSSYQGDWGLILPRITVVSSQEYTVSANSDGKMITILERDENGTQLSSHNNVSGSSYSFTTGVSTTAIDIVFNGEASEEFTVEDIMLNVGDTALVFEPQQRSYLFFGDLELRSNPTTGADADELIVNEDGNYAKLAKWRKMTLDGSLTGTFSDDHTGFKRVYLTTPYDSSFGAYVVKYDGKILIKGSSTSNADRFDGHANKDRIYISIADNDSGWGEDYTPSSAEIEAYFNGWKMFHSETNRSTPYNGTGTKAWYPITREFDTFDAQYKVITTAPSYTADNKDDWQYYQLQYQLEEPIVEPITQPEGELRLFEGKNQIIMGAGVIAREGVTPSLQSTGANYGINSISGYTPSNPLNNRAGNIFEIYRNGAVDDDWSVGTSSLTAWSGGGFAFIPAGDFEETAAYSATYFALDMYKLGIAPQSISAVYQGNANEVITQHTKQIQQHGTRISVIENTFARKQQGGLIQATLVNAWSHKSGNEVYFYKDEMGIVHFSGLMFGGTITDDTIITYMPPGYLPEKAERFPLVNYTDAIAVNVGLIVFNVNGQVKIYDLGTVQNVPMSNISYRAQQ